MTSPALATAMKNVRLLKEARDYITPRKHWTKGALKTNAGVTVCALGALSKVTDCESYPGDAELVYALAHARAPQKADVYMKPIRDGGPRKSNLDNMMHIVVEYNDNIATHEEVLALFDKAIEEQCRIVREEAEKNQ